MTQEKQLEQGKARAMERRQSTPFSVMRRMMEDFERMFDEPILGRSVGGLIGGMSRGPAIDVLERNDQLVIRADLPGYQKEDIKLEMTEDGVILEGERKEEKEENEGGFYRRERTYGSFRRLIPLPEGVDPEQVRAEMKNGVLEVCFPIPEQRRMQRKRIDISESATQPAEKTEQKKKMH